MVRVNEKLLKEITVLAKDGYGYVDGTNSSLINFNSLTLNDSLSASDGYFSNQVVINGKLTVDGIIDPTGLVLDEQSSVPGGTPAAGKSVIWVRDSDGYTIITNSSGTDIVLNGIIDDIVPGSGNSNKILQANSSGNGLDYSIIDSSLSSDTESDGLRHFKRNDVIVITDFPYSASRDTTSTTGTISYGSVNLAVADGSSFLYHQGLVIQGAGEDHGLPTPSAPEVYQQGSTGSSTIEIKVVAATRHRGYTAASATTQITDGAATLTSDNWLGVWPEIIEGATWYLIYMRRGTSGDFTLRKIIPAQLNPSNGSCMNIPVAVIDSEDLIFVPGMIPSTAPNLSQSNYLRARVVSGEGTNNLVLDRAASTAVSNLNVYHDDWEALNDAIDSFSLLNVYSNGGHIYMPRGKYMIWDDLRISRNITLEGAGGGLAYSRTFITPYDSLYGIAIEGSYTAPQWVPGVPVRVGERMRPQKYWQNADYLWVCTTAGTTGTTYPTFTYSAGTTINDGTVVWTCYAGASTGQQSLLTNFSLYPQYNTGPALAVGAFEVIRESWIGTSPNAVLWTPGLSISSGYWLLPPDGYETGFRYRVSGSGTTGSTPPDFGKIEGGTTVDNGVNLIAEWTPIVWGAGFLINERAVIKNVGVYGINGTAFYLNGKSYTEKSNCNGFSIEDFYAAACGGGTYTEGTDSSVGAFSNGTVTACGFGSIDISFFGNKYSNVLYEGNLLGPQNSAYSGSQYMLYFENCYWEDDLTTGDHYVYRPARGSGGMLGGVQIIGNMFWDPFPSGSSSGTKLFTTETYVDPKSTIIALAWSQYTPLWMYTSAEDSENRGDYRMQWDSSARRWLFGLKGGSGYRIVNEMLQNYSKLDSFKINRPLVCSMGEYGNKYSLGITNSIPVHGVWKAGDTLMWGGETAARFAIKNIYDGAAAADGYDGYTVWSSSTTYLLNESEENQGQLTVVVCNTAQTAMFALVKQGISGGTEPSWNTSSEAFTQDGSCWWQYWGTPRNAEWVAISNSSPVPNYIGNSDVNVYYTDRYLITNVDYTADRTLTLLTEFGYDYAMKGDRIDITRGDSGAFSAHVNNWDSSLITDLEVGQSGEFVFDGIDWILLKKYSIV